MGLNKALANDSKAVKKKEKKRNPFEGFFFLFQN